jgi:hypothetical protein
LDGDTDRPELPGQRPSGRTAATSLHGLHLRLLGNLQRVVDPDREVPDGAFRRDNGEYACAVGTPRCRR